MVFFPIFYKQSNIIIEFKKKGTECNTNTKIKTDQQACEVHLKGARSKFNWNFLVIMD